MSQQETEIRPHQPGASPLTALITDEVAEATQAGQSPIDEVINPKPALLVYDASASQKIPYHIEHEGARYTIMIEYAPLTDDLVKEHEIRKNLRLTEADQEESAHRSGIVQQSDVMNASAWLFDVAAIRPYGFGNSDDEVPADWKEQFEDAEKADMVDGTILAGLVLEAPLVPAGKRLPWNRAKGSSTHTLRCIYNGTQMDTKHILRAGDADTASEFKSLMARGVLIQGTKLGKSETYIPCRMGRLGEFYDRLKEKVEGYRDGKVPLHHKALIVIDHLGSQVKAATKNS
jgi:hypothetical protein